VPSVQPASDPRRAIFIHCDEATLCTDGELLVSGWSVCATGIAAVDVCVGGEMIGKAELGLPRPDVAGEFAEIPQAHYSGFRMKHWVLAPVARETRLTIVARNGLDDTHDLAITVAATPPLSRPSQSALADPKEFQFQLDHPVVINDVAPEAVVGRMVIEGWALARSGIEAIDVFLDGCSLGQAYYGTLRRDVEAAFPDWPDSLRCGYIFHCPPRALESGTHIIRLQFKAKCSRIIETEFRIDVQQSHDSEDYATIRRHLSRAEIDLFDDILSRLGNRPRFGVLLAAEGSIDLERFEITLGALAGQAYSDWTLMVVAGTPEPADLLAAADRAGVSDRVTIIAADASSDLLGAVSGDRPADLVGVLFPGDELGCDALAEIAIGQGLHPEAEFFYADEDRVSPSSRLREPFFKPAWSPDLLLSTNYIGRPWFATAELLAKVGITPRSLLASQGDYDAVLRRTELIPHIHHLPKLLCRRDDAETPDPEAERWVLQRALVRRSIEAVLLPGCIPGTWRLKRSTPAEGKVSIIIPTCAAQGYVATCLETLRSRTAYRDFEIICIDNIPPELPEWKALIRERADKVVDIPEAFNWSRFNNRAVDQAGGEYLLFLNDDIEIERADWLDALLEHAGRPEVGIVGAQLLFPNRKVQHAGIFLTTLGAGRHAFRFLAEDDPGYFGLALTQRNVIAVTGACMLIRREVFERIGRFDEAHDVVNNDVDCCLRSWRAGLSVVYTPHAQLIHHELASRAKIKDIYDTGHFAKQWRGLYATGDPYFSPRLTKFADEYRPDTEPARMICAGRPLFRMGEIRRILVVKLDHIGDLLTALPALRRLRRHFPTAHIHLLAGASARAFLAGEDCVDELIEFEFFHARSGLGEKALTEDDLRALVERLTPYRFDLAIDLRKQMETRHVLKYVPARWRAGYDSQGRFPWLDVALEWEGDNKLRRKQSHISDDLLRLMDAVATAGEGDRSVLPRPAGGVAGLPAGVSAKARALFRKPVVAVHAGVGAIMRQWMPVFRGGGRSSDREERRECGADRRPRRGGAGRAGVGERGQPEPRCVGGRADVAGGTDRAAGRVRAVSGQQQRTEAHRRRAGGADRRHPLGGGGCRRMGADRAAGDRRAAQHGVQSVLSGEAGGLRARHGLFEEVGAGGGSRVLRNDAGKGGAGGCLGRSDGEGSKQAGKAHQAEARCRLTKAAFYPAEGRLVTDWCRCGPGLAKSPGRPREVK
jgi:GT2 family glycosyltransferase